MSVDRPSPIGLTYLPPEIAEQVLVSTYVCVGALAVYIWDMLNSVKQEYRLFVGAKFRFSTFAYVVASMSYCSIAGFLLTTIAYPLGTCHLTYRVVDAFYPVSVSSIALLFYIRVRAIYSHGLFITVFFGALWLAVLGTSLTITFGGDAEPIGPTKYCLVTKLDSYVGASAIVITAHDTAVFLAISYRLITNTLVLDSHLDLLKALVNPVYLPSFSRSLFVDGQSYYMISVLSNILVTTMVYVNVSPLYRGFLNIPNIALTSAMACRVYRNTRLGLTREAGNMALSLSVPLTGVQGAASGGRGPTIPLVLTQSFLTTQQAGNEAMSDSQTPQVKTSCSRPRSMSWSGSHTPTEMV
ncbi:hypothetical protein FB45DRAFT_841714 [Roridomyces roridus]|uniref:Uncharacterized protein n=1 Tax=Roridomyces roridus TaxID=1738132 RepID=A0AAD7BBY5_9AGAR|nr:hypothetical protein FB45DRAFT_841714 [Roridomyces roridus]